MDDVFDQFLQIVGQLHTSRYGERIPMELTPAERDTLLQWSRADAGEHRQVERARIILLAGDGLGTRAIARQLHTRAARISKWRQRSVRHRLAGLLDRPRSGKPVRHTQETEKQILRQLDQSPPSGYSQWSGPPLARALPGISDDRVWRVLRKHKVQLQLPFFAWRIWTAFDGYAGRCSSVRGPGGPQDRGFSVFSPPNTFRHRLSSMDGIRAATATCFRRRMMEPLKSTT